MSITAVKDKEVTVVTVASDSTSMFPPLCQILRALCYSPVCCSRSKGLMQVNVTAALGTVQIMVGLFNIGLGPGRTCTHPGDITDLRAAYWLGAMYIVAGAMAVSAGRCQALCLTGFVVFLNIVGAIFAIVGIVLYAIDLGDASILWMCDGESDNCRRVAYFAQRLLTGMDITLIVLGALQLCVGISVAVLGIRAIASRSKEKGGSDVDFYQPLLKGVLVLKINSSKHVGA